MTIVYVIGIVIVLTVVLIIVVIVFLIILVLLLLHGMLEDLLGRVWERDLQCLYRLKEICPFQQILVLG